MLVIADTMQRLQLFNTILLMESANVKKALAGTKDGVMLRIWMCFL